MHDGAYFNDWNWLAMGSLMFLWIVLIGVAVYFGIRLTTRSPRGEV